MPIQMRPELLNLTGGEKFDWASVQKFRLHLHLSIRF